MDYRTNIYNDLMRRIGMDVRHAINEKFNFERNEIGDMIAELINKNENVKNVILEATCDEWRELIDTIAEMRNKGVPSRCPASITDMNALACFIIKGIGSKVSKIYNYSDDEKEGLARYMCDLYSTASGPNRELFGCGGKNKDSKGKPSVNSCNDNDDGYDEKDRLNDCCARNRRMQGKAQISENNPRSWRRGF